MLGASIIKWNLTMEIVLIRHGQPTVDKNVKLSATQFANWLDEYNNSSIVQANKPPTSLTEKISSHFVISSDLPRAINSAKVCVGKKPDLIIKHLKEMPIPHWSLPLITNAYAWIIINGLMWAIGLHGQVDSLWCCRKRGKLAARTLSSMAEQKQNIAVFGHVIMNYYIALQLVRQGWRANFTGKKFWSSLTLTRQ